MWANGFMTFAGWLWLLGFGSPEFAGGKCLANVPFETFGWVGVLGFHSCFAMALAYVLVAWRGPMGL